MQSEPKKIFSIHCMDCARSCRDRFGVIYFHVFVFGYILVIVMRLWVKLQNPKLEKSLFILLQWNNGQISRRPGWKLSSILVRNLCCMWGCWAAEVVVPPSFSRALLICFLHGVGWITGKDFKRAGFILCGLEHAGGSDVQILRRMVNDRWGIMNSSSELEDGTRHKNQVRAHILYSCSLDSWGVVHLLGAVLPRSVWRCGSRANLCTVETVAADELFPTPRALALLFLS